MVRVGSLEWMIVEMARQAERMGAIALPSRPDLAAEVPVGLPRVLRRGLDCRLAWDQIAAYFRPLDTFGPHVTVCPARSPMSVKGIRYELIVRVHFGGSSQVPAAGAGAYAIAMRQAAEVALVLDEMVANKTFQYAADMSDD